MKVAIIAACQLHALFFQLEMCIFKYTIAIKKIPYKTIPGLQGQGKRWSAPTVQSCTENCKMDHRKLKEKKSQILFPLVQLDRLLSIYCKQGEKEIIA
jgi:hypothetical protein